MRQALLSAAAAASGTTSGAAGAVASLQTAAASLATLAYGNSGDSHRAGSSGDPVADAAEAQQWAIAGLFAILIGGSIGEPQPHWCLCVAG